MLPWAARMAPFGCARLVRVSGCSSGFTSFPERWEIMSIDINVRHMFCLFSHTIYNFCTVPIIHDTSISPIMSGLYLKQSGILAAQIH